MDIDASNLSDENDDSDYDDDTVHDRNHGNGDDPVADRMDGIPDEENENDVVDDDHQCEDDDEEDKDDNEEDNDDDEDDDDDDDKDDDDEDDGDDENDDDDEEDKNGDNDVVEHNDNRSGGDRQFFSLTSIPNADVPLIPKLNKTVQDHVLSAIAMSVRHRLTYEATIDSLKWIKSMYHSNSIPTTKDAFWKCLSRNSDLLTYHYYCRKCHDYLGLKDTKTEELLRQCQCGECRPDDKLETNLSSFIYINLTAQIEELLSLPNISESLQYRFHRIKKDPNGYEDIYDGLEYKSLSTPGNFLETWHNFSLTINTDGCQASKSSNLSAWPLYAQINELPPHMRKKHMLLAAIFVDDKHPVMNNFLRPFTTEMQQLFTTGVRWNPSSTSVVTSRLIVTTCSLDAPARAAVTCLKQFNGAFGCIYCYAKGKSLRRGKYVYPLSQSYKRIRTDAELRQDMAQVFDTGKIIRGVKNVSALVSLPLFDIPKGVVVEAMHAVFLGVIRQHTKLLLMSTNAPYYIGSPEHKTSIDKYLLQIRPPSCRSRKPRSISTYAKWKASEWRNWLDYAPICLQEILPIKYVNHIALLSEVIHYVNSDCISLVKLDRCDMLMKKYVKLFENFFGVDNMTSNIHTLTHLIQIVRNWGPIWVHEAFVFESWNKKIMDFVTSPHCQTNQIVTRFLMHKFIITALYDKSVSPETKTFIAKQIKISINNNRIRIRNRIIGLGKCITRSPTDHERAALMNAGYKPTSIKCFNKMKINEIKYECKNNNNNKFCNSTIVNDNGIFGTVIAIVNFNHNNKLIGGILFQKMRHVNHAFNTEYINEVTMLNDIAFIKESELMNPAIQIFGPNKMYVTEQPNC